MKSIIYGIKNCDTVKKSLTWLKNKDISFDFHDYKSKGISEEKLKQWSKQKGWENLINKKGMTWRQLDEVEKNKVTNEAEAIALMTRKTSVIRRPIVERDGVVLSMGFDETEFSKLFK